MAPPFPLIDCTFYDFKMGGIEPTFVQIIGKKREYVTQIIFGDLGKYWKAEWDICAKENTQ